ncbi:hypothetical protein OG500_20530 [Kitasatospora sp. NBC_01250]|uniref:DUF6879 family protein n=1 Tax=Kitasatospora sp. NBC_01250 TaxID=2903571 RepID=UPI002E350947|nr:DUF6879 family protein [Kitasatospora sp. NBC_01250]
MSQSDWIEPFRAARVSAVHLEMRDHYAVGNESGPFDTWRETGEADVDPDSDMWRPWTSVVRDLVARGVVMRRARIVSEPVTEYIRYEHAGTSVNLAVGEQVRWLPRSRASDIALPGNDFWLFDGSMVVFNHFTGDGEWSSHGTETRTEQAVIKLCQEAFEVVWQRAIPHQDYDIR